ncbi:uncharacterized protein LOC121686960 [Alosa sapidissima]|uniref:uncharacterized protein LOC121686960 n=1 Tax=Alosa sapidissima TaxID=34773 RepID=UPI001C08D9A3|nr:uncharacterized protein LOC121686960 [Alosa sapidissima]
MVSSSPKSYLNPPPVPPRATSTPLTTPVPPRATSTPLQFPQELPQPPSPLQFPQELPQPPSSSPKSYLNPPVPPRATSTPLQFTQELPQPPSPLQFPQELPQPPSSSPKSYLNPPVPPRATSTPLQFTQELPQPSSSPKSYLNPPPVHPRATSTPLTTPVPPRATSTPLQFHQELPQPPSSSPKSYLNPPHHSSSPKSYLNPPHHSSSIWEALMMDLTFLEGEVDVFRLNASSSCPGNRSKPDIIEDISFYKKAAIFEIRYRLSIVSRIPLHSSLCPPTTCLTFKYLTPTMMTLFHLPMCAGALASRDSPWSNHPSEQILELLEKQGIPVKSGTPREDLLSMALSILGTLSISDQEDIASPEAPAQPKKASRKRPAKPPPSQPGKRAYKAPTRPQPSASQIQTSPASDQSIVDAILSLTSTVKGLEARMEAFERPSTSTPAASLNISAFSHAPLPSTSSFLPAAFRPPAHSAGAPLTEASALAGLHTFNLASALPAQDPALTAIPPLFALKASTGIRRLLLSMLLQRSPPKVGLPPANEASYEREACNNIKTILSGHPSTPINVPALSHFLSSHPDPSFVNFLITGLSQGFRVGVLSPLRTSYVARNLLSALSEPLTVSSLLAREVNKGYVVGPFSSPPFSPFRVNSIGVTTRKHSGKKRLIFDMSSPHSERVASVNECIPLYPFSLYYASVDNAAHLIKIAGQGAWLSKADITDAFKVMPIHPSEWPLFWVKWESKFYFAVRLTFGCRSSPHIFNCLSEALCWILLNVYKLPFVLHLLDDFLLIDFPSAKTSVLDTLRQTFSTIGVPLSEEKTVGPLTSLEFLGIMLDSVKMQASLPEEKLLRIRAITASFVSSSAVSKRELLSLLGHLNFAMRIIPQGRSFISRLLNLAHSVEKLSDLVQIDEGSRSDLRFWSQLLNNWNGISFFYNEVPESSASLDLFTDAAPSVGFGGVFQGQWFAEKWPAEFSAFALGSASSALHELYPVVVASVLWGGSCSRKRITLHCDNAAVVGMINKGRSSSAIIMPLLRRLTWQSVMHNFIINAEHIPGYCNVLADALSRSRFQEFRRRCPTANPEPTPCPAFTDLILD